MQTALGLCGGVGGSDYRTLHVHPLAETLRVQIRLGSAHRQQQNRSGRDQHPGSDTTTSAQLREMISLHAHILTNMPVGRIVEISTRGNGPCRAAPGVLRAVYKLQRSHPGECSEIADEVSLIEIA